MNDNSLKIEFSVVQTEGENVISDTFVRVLYPEMPNAQANVMNAGMTEGMFAGAIGFVKEMAKVKAGEL